jgi:predicted helicase
MNNMVYQMHKIFPDAAAKNMVICMNAVGAQKEFSVLMSDQIPDLHLMQTGQCFPLYLYGEAESELEAADSKNSQSELFNTENRRVGVRPHLRQDAISVEGLEYIQSAYPGEILDREDVFYYVYGLLHSPDYRERFADNLGKELPRIPCVKTASDFWAFAQAGRKLAELHVNYESVEPYLLKIDSGGQALTDADYRVEKMRYGKGNGKDKDLTTLHYNDRITLTGIPLEAYDYVVNGKPALDWVVERQGVKTDKDSGIVNDANDWAVETMGNPRYSLELFQRVVTVSLETMRIVRGLPALSL